MKKLTITLALFIAGFVTYAGSDDAFVYPNPSQDQIFLQLPDNVTGITDLTIFDLSGREVYATERDRDDHDFKNLQIPVTGLANGTYIIRITANERIVSTMFTKQE